MAEALRILQLNSMLLGGGTDDQVEKLSRGLLELNHKVWVYGPAGRDYSRILAERGVPFVSASKGKLSFIAGASRFVKENKIQIIHGHHGRDLWPTVFAAWMSGVFPRIVLTRHMAKSPSSFFSRHYLLNRCDALIAVSKFVRRVLTEGVFEPDSVEEERRARSPILGDYSRVKVIYGGIDTSRFKPMDVKEQREKWGLQEDDFVFGVVGGFYSPGGKGQWQFLEAAAQVHQKHPQAKFLVIGRGNLEEQLNKRIVELGLAGKARLSGYCDNMPVGMNALDCLVHPAVGTEALGLVVVEAMACGKPVIASDMDGIPEAFEVGGNGVLIRPRSVEDLANAMERMLEQGKPNLAQRQELHLKVTNRFSYQTMAETTAALYRELLTAENRMRA